MAAIATAAAAASSIYAKASEAAAVAADGSHAIAAEAAAKAASAKNTKAANAKAAAVARISLTRDPRLSFASDALADIGLAIYADGKGTAGAVSSAKNRTA
jgi:hypothetical protein